MTSQASFTLNPSYSGPMVLAENLRKMKSNNGLNRMLSSYNQRFFVLDLNHCTFYYLPDRKSHFTNATDIPLSSIISIKVTKQSAGLEEDRIWKHEFVITTKKKILELITDSKHFMEKMLLAFGNIVNTKTNKPLFNWNHYIGSQENHCSPSNFPVSKPADNSPQKEASFTSPEKSPVDIKALQPEQRGELSAELPKVEKNEKEEVQQSPDRESCGSDDQKENKQNQERAQKKPASMQIRRKGNSFAALRGKGFAVDEEQAKAEQKEASSPVRSEQVESGQVHEREEQVEMKKSLSPVKMGGKIEINVKMLNFDKVDHEDDQEHRPVVNSSRDMPRKYNPGEQSVRRVASRLVMANKSASMKNMAEKEGDLVGFNQIELPNNKVRSSKFGDGAQGQASARRACEKQASFGTGVVQEASRFSLFKQSEKPVEVKKSEKNDDDWDNEMFGDGKTQLSPLKPKNHEEKQRPSYDNKYMSSDKKIQSQLSQKRSEFVASRQGTHNDWDDEL